LKKEKEMSKRLFLFILAAMVCINGTVEAKVLGQLAVNDHWGAIMTNGTGATLKFGWYTPGPFPDYFYSMRPCFEWNFYTADVGKTFYSNSQTNPNFNEIAAILTNGVNNGLYHADSTISFDGTTGYYLTMDSSITKYGIQGVDFYGCTIDSIAFRLDRLQLLSPGSNPNGNGNYTDFYLQGSIIVNGVPEPATLLLLGLGAAIVREKARRVRKRR
jgi:hypothetical protein